ncbi:DUF1972 domain-containing protein [Pontibacter sp. G13]|uniref:DUF1972 domain-containing protein n=1 Tax=Pontibacter sp. G13 TaxID=3074898 RepID=UPI00288B8652|nr:DUF1972 domain-containing protein [Pontibacter sp. G13]WNJ18924.1 DUF1972 domain-containing protein [Pontibacter sp. G13]
MHHTARVSVIGVVGVPARYGGFETLAHHFVLNLADRYQITVFNSQKVYKPEERMENWEGAQMEYLPLEANGIQSIPYDIVAMMKSVRQSDVMVVLGVSGCLALPLFKMLFPNKVWVINIDGLEWRRPKWGTFAKKYLKFAERIAVRFADRIVADNEWIQHYVVDHYGRSQGLDLIAYGGDHVNRVEITPEDIVAYPFLAESYSMMVGRIEPENNIGMILEAFANMPDQPFALVGNWDSSAYGRSLKAQYSGYDNIHIIDYISDMRTLDLLRGNCRVYIHGHSAGGTNPALVEAMNLSRPVFAYDVNFNFATTEGKARYFATSGELIQLMNTVEQVTLTEISMDMKEIADRRYTWNQVSNQYAQSIEYALEGKGKLQSQVE